MKVTVDKNSGFCWGVIRTIDIAELELNEIGKLYSLGSIIHNPMEIQRLEKKGLRTITHNDMGRVKGEKVLIRAHGEPPETYEKAKRYKIKLIDATCPVVSKVQERIKKFYNDGYQVVIFGKIDHAEVIGLVGQTNGKAIVVKSLEEVGKIDYSKKTVLFSQTTMDKPTFYAIRDELARRIKEFVVDSFEQEAIEFHAKDTICGQVSGREKKLREFAASHDVIVFVAGRASSNGKVLFNIACEVNPATYFIENVSELKDEWFYGKDSVGITGSTSTPQWLMDHVKQKIEEKVLVIT